MTLLSNTTLTKGQAGWGRLEQIRSPNPSKTVTADGSRSELECRVVAAALRADCSVFPPPSYLHSLQLPDRSSEFTCLINISRDCSIFPRAFAIVVPQCSLRFFITALFSIRISFITISGLWIRALPYSIQFWYHRKVIKTKLLTAHSPLKSLSVGRPNKGKYWAEESKWPECENSSSKQAWCWYHLGKSIRAENCIMNWQVKKSGFLFPWPREELWPWVAWSMCQ